MKCVIGLFYLRGTLFNLDFYYTFIKYFLDIFHARSDLCSKKKRDLRLYMDFKITEYAEKTLRKQLEKAGEGAVVTIDDARGC